MADFEPLNAIKQVEANTIRRIARAHEDSRHIRADAENQAADILNKARAQAKYHAQTIRQTVLTQAEADEQAILTEAEQQVDALVIRGQSLMDEAVERATGMILGGQETQR